MLLSYTPIPVVERKACGTTCLVVQGYMLVRHRSTLDSLDPNNHQEPKVFGSLGLLDIPSLTINKVKAFAATPLRNTRIHSQALCYTCYAMRYMRPRKY